VANARSRTPQPKHWVVSRRWWKFARAVRLPLARDSYRHAAREVDPTRQGALDL